MRVPHAVGLAAVALIVGPAPAHAQEQPRLAFVDQSKISLSLKKATRGRTAELCNTGSATLSSFTARFAGFDFELDKVPFPEGEVFVPPVYVAPQDERRPRPLAPGECERLRIRVRQGPLRVDAGEYAGMLAVTGPGVGVVRREITLSVVTPPAPAAPALEPLGEAKLEASRQGPLLGGWWDTVDMRGGGALLLKDPGPNAKPLPEDTFLGDVIKDTEVGELRVDGEWTRPVEGVVRLPVRVEGIDEVGTYKGELDLNPDSDGDKKVPVTLEVTDAVQWAIAAIVLGAWLAMWPQLRLRRWRPERILHERLRALPVRYKIAGSYWDEHRKKTAGPDGVARLPDLKQPSAAELARYSRKVDTAIRTYAKSTIYFDTSSDAYKEIQASLELAEKDADCYQQRECLAEALLTLRSALAGFETYLKEKFPVDRRPEFVAAAASLLAEPQPGGGDLKVGEASERAKEAAGWTEFIANWQAMADEARRYHFWALLLEHVQMTPRHDALVRRAHAKVHEAGEEMLDAADAAGLESVGAASDLREAYDILSRIGPHYNVWASLGDADRAAEVEAALARAEIHEESAYGIRLTAPRRLKIRDRLEGYASRLTASAGVVGDLLTAGREMFFDAAEGLALAAGSRSAWDFVTLALAVTVALFTGLTAFYFGKTFGTFQDYLAVLISGTAAQVLVKAITDTVAAQWTSVAPPAASIEQKTAGASANAPENAA